MPRASPRFACRLQRPSSVRQQACALAVWAGKPAAATRRLWDSCPSPMRCTSWWASTLPHPLLPPSRAAPAAFPGRARHAAPWALCCLSCLERAHVLAHVPQPSRQSAPQAERCRCLADDCCDASSLRRCGCHPSRDGALWQSMLSLLQGILTRRVTRRHEGVCFSAEGGCDTPRTFAIRFEADGLVMGSPSLAGCLAGSHRIQAVCGHAD